MHIEIVFKLIFIHVLFYIFLGGVHSKTLTRYFTDKYNDIWQLCWAQAQVMNFVYPQSCLTKLNAKCKINNNLLTAALLTQSVFHALRK